MTTEKIKFRPSTIDHLNTFILAAITDASDPKESLEKFGLKPRQIGEPDYWEIDIEFKINGVECSFEHYFHRILAEMDAHIVEKAHELLEEKLRDFSETIYDLDRFIKIKANEKLGYVKDEW